LEAFSWSAALRRLWLLTTVFFFPIVAAVGCILISGAVHST
jgi:hypothetical protein